jgi:exodeoxyribonuclease VII large subunit
VPVRADLLEQLSALSGRLLSAGGRGLRQRRDLLEGLGRGLIHPGRMLEERSQRLDDIGERLRRALQGGLERRRAEVAEWSARLPHPRQQVRGAEREVGDWGARLVRLRGRLLEPRRRDFKQLEAGRRMARAWRLKIETVARNLSSYEKLLESYSYHNVLKRGFAVVRSGGKVVVEAAAVGAGQALEIEWRDGKRAAVAAGGASSPPQRGAPRRKSDSSDDQGSLL